MLKKHSPKEYLYENQWKTSSKTDSVETPFSNKFSEMTPLALKALQTHPRMAKDVQNWGKGCPRRSLLGALAFIFRPLTRDGVPFVVMSIRRQDRLGSRVLLQRHSWQFCSSATQPHNMISDFWLRSCSRHAKNLNGTVAECARSAFGYHIFIFWRTDLFAKGLKDCSHIDCNPLFRLTENGRTCARGSCSRFCVTIMLSEW